MMLSPCPPRALANDCMQVKGVSRVDSTNPNPECEFVAESILRSEGSSIV